MSKHTPKPWRVEGPGDDPYGNIGIFAEAPSRLVCELWQDDAAHDYNPEQWANARLIATAPDFAAEARAMVERHDAEAKRVNFDRCGCENCFPFRALLNRIDGGQP